ncbi:MAG: DUF2029 domain-containing protein [Candidatus Nanopelagicales bacterium]|nr:DUF2029 domain-containing protein [Candidatus Nanopelagicales bacterium]MCF8557993.1 DUF2029 domain-containing protein [Candidatus Nanopelagicales bacterium]
MPPLGQGMSLLKLGDDLVVRVNPAGELELAMGDLLWLTPLPSPSDSHDVMVDLTGSRVAVVVDENLVLTNDGRPVDVRSAVATIGPNTATGSLRYDLSVRGEPLPGWELWLNGLALVMGLALALSLAWTVIGWLGSPGLVPLPTGTGVLVGVAAVTIGATYAISLVGRFIGAFPYQFAPAEVRFSDLYQVLLLGQANPYAVKGANYPPTSLVLGQGLQGFPDATVVSLVIIGSWGILLGLLVVSLRLGHRYYGVVPALVLALCFPVLFAVDRGNVDLVMVALAGLGMATMLRGHRVSSAFAWGMTLALKVYPLLLLAPTLRRRSGLQVAAGAVAVGAVLAVVSGWALGQGPLSTAMITSGAGDAESLTLEQKESWGLSLASGVRVFAHYLAPGTLDVQAIDGWLGEQGRWMAIILLLSTCLWVVLLEARWWRGMALVAIAILIFPSVTFQYRAMLLLLPLVCLGLSRDEPRRPITYGLLVGLLLGPVGWIALGDGGTVTISSVILPLVALGLFFLLLVDSWQEREPVTFLGGPRSSDLSHTR